MAPWRKILLASALEEGVVERIRSLVSEARPRSVAVVEDARMGATSVGEATGPEARRRQKARLRHLYKGAKVRFVRLGSDAYESLEEAFGDADLVHVEGGQTMMLTLALSRRPRVLALLRKTLQEKGGVGQSAGAIVMGSFNTSTIKRETGDLPSWLRYARERGIDDARRDRETTLGKTRCGVMTHANERREYAPRVEKYLASRAGAGRCVYALGDDGYMVVDSRSGKLLEHSGLEIATL